MPSDIHDLQQKIRASIPLSEAMEFSIIELDSHSILVQAPLEPNVNIHGTGFAGSIYSLAVLAGWALCTHIMKLNGMQGELVVGSAEIKYRLPLSSAISCRSQTSEEDCLAFRNDFEACGKGKLGLEIVVGNSRNAILQGKYIAINNT